MVTKKRKRIKALVWLLLCGYGVLFVGQFWAGHQGRGVGQPVVGQATDISCERNWLLLGTRWSCTATIVDDQGKRYSFSNGASLLTADDVGKSVPMVAQSWRRSPDTWIPARDDSDPKPLPGGLMMIFVVSGIIGAMIMWPKKDKPDSPPPPPTTEQKADKARKLRRISAASLSACVVLAVYSWLAWGTFVADRSTSTRMQREGFTATATTCSRDPWFLWLSWSCEVTISGEEFLGEREQFAVTIDHSHFTPTDIGATREMYRRSNNSPFGSQYLYIRKDLPKPPTIATWWPMGAFAAFWLLIAGLVTRSSARKLGQPATLQNPNIQPTTL